MSNPGREHSRPIYNFPSPRYNPSLITSREQDRMQRSFPGFPLSRKNEWSMMNAVIQWMRNENYALLHIWKRFCLLTGESPCLYVYTRTEISHGPGGTRVQYRFSPPHSQSAPPMPYNSLLSFAASWTTPPIRNSSWLFFICDSPLCLSVSVCASVTII